MVKKAIHTFRIILNKQPLVYYTGETVTGRLLLQLQKPVQIKSIEANLFGRSRFRSSRRVNNHTRYTTTEQKFIEKNTTLWGNPNGKNETLLAGSYEYEFNFILQSEVKMPSSVELTMDGNYIRYEINVILNNGKMSQCRAIKPFTFLEAIDLNSPEFMEPPIPTKDCRTVYSYCCIPGQAKIRIKTDRRGYCPGDTIRFHVQCENFSNKKIKHLKAEFVRSVLLQQNEKGCRYRILTETYGSIISTEPIQGGKTYTWLEQSFTVPSVSPTIKSKYVCVSYELQITPKIQFWGNKTTVAPIIIASIPLNWERNQITNPPPPVNNNNTSIDVSRTQQQSVTFTPYVHGGFHINSSERVFCDEKFTPIYPVTRYDHFGS